MSAQRFGLTWWGKRWIASLEALGAAYANRLPRGRTYARKGTVDRLAIGPGRVTADVAGSRPAPYRVVVSLPTFTDGEWHAAVAALAGQVRHAAALLDGRMPDDVDDVLGRAGLSLFPRGGELSTACSCPDVANPCKHVAAVHYVLATAFDDDPFLLPALRGRDRDTLLAALRSARSGPPPRAGAAGNAGDPGRAGDSPGGAGTGVAGHRVDTGAPGSSGEADGTGVAGGGRRGDRAPAGPKDRAPGAVPLTALSAASLFAAAGDLATVALHPRRADDPTALLRRLGPPPGADGPDRAALHDAVIRAAHHATAILWSDTPSGPPEPRDDTVGPRDRSPAG